jgi:2-polyprenyl-6-methoxyphenol hydroxylase-like FAD-dependent oxidoreductase
LRDSVAVETPPTVAIGSRPICERSQAGDLDGCVQRSLAAPSGCRPDRAPGRRGLHRQRRSPGQPLADRVAEIHGWDDVKLLTVAVNRLPVWYRPGLLFIGDAAHAMSPIGGVGINLAIQDAVATANLLTDDLQRGAPGLARLAAVQRRREFPTKVIQGFQVFMHDRVLGRVLGAQRPFRLPFLFRIVDAVKPLRWLPAWFIGVGVRPEHVHTGVSPQAERSPRPSSHDNKT